MPPVGYTRGCLPRVAPTGCTREMHPQGVTHAVRPRGIIDIIRSRLRRFSLNFKGTLITRSWCFCYVDLVRISREQLSLDLYKKDDIVQIDGAESIKRKKSRGHLTREFSENEFQKAIVFFPIRIGLSTECISKISLLLKPT